MISLTPLAAEKVQYHLDRRGQGQGIRVGIKTTGCSGLAYVLEYVDLEPSKQDSILYESNGIKIWVDPKSLVYVNGLSIDYQKKGLNEGFEFINPNEKNRCGCGESFNI